MIWSIAKKPPPARQRFFLQGRVQQEEDRRITSQINSGKSGQEIKFSGYQQSQNNFC
jgi:hypothetical protein